jgi:hypothetical protein
MELSAQQWTLLLGAQSLVGVEDFPFFLKWLHFLMKYYDMHDNETLAANPH